MAAFVFTYCRLPVSALRGMTMRGMTMTKMKRWSAVLSLVIKKLGTRNSHRLINDPMINDPMTNDPTLASRRPAIP
jgi:hypothetical protein